MNPSELPLRDIHLPDPIGWWPLAPGWWVLLAVLLVAIALATWRYLRQDRRLLRLATRELNGLQRRYAQTIDAREFLLRVSQLLRRFAMAKVGRERSAGLQGSAWQEFLNAPLPDAPFSQLPGQLLIDAVYRPDLPPLDKQQVSRLSADCRRWLNALSTGKAGP